MICNNCSKELPEGSGFCPYCLHKFTEEKVITPEPFERRNAKSAAAVAAAVLLVVILSIAAVFFRISNKENNSLSAESVTSTVATTQEPEQELETTEDPERFEERMVEEKPYVTDENGETSYPLVPFVVIVDEDGNIKQGYVPPE